jgi:hypothetical protein
MRVLDCNGDDESLEMTGDHTNMDPSFLTDSALCHTIKTDWSGRQESRDLVIFLPANFGR